MRDACLTGWMHPCVVAWLPHTAPAIRALPPASSRSAGESGGRGGEGWQISAESAWRGGVGEGGGLGGGGPGGGFDGGDKGGELVRRCVVSRKVN